MKRSMIVLSLAAVALAGLAVAAWAQDAHSGHGGPVVPKHGAPATQPAKAGSPAQALTDLETALASARKAADAGDAKTAAAELAKAQKALAALKEQLKAPAAAHAIKPVNAQCPMMGGKVDPDKTPAELTRQFQGQTVGFCCGGCPASWDKLTDEQKAAQLAKSAPKAATPDPHAGHMR